MYKFTISLSLFFFFSMCCTQTSAPPSSTWSELTLKFVQNVCTTAASSRLIYCKLVRYRYIFSCEASPLLSRINAFRSQSQQLKYQLHKQNSKTRTMIKEKNKQWNQAKINRTDFRHKDHLVLRITSLLITLFRVGSLQYLINTFPLHHHFLPSVTTSTVKRIKLLNST